MLHIILLILKIIGIILLSILGLIIIVLSIILFCPVKYRAEGSINNELKSLEAQGKVSWLFSILKITFEYRESEFKWKGRILWIKLDEDEIDDLDFDIQKKVKNKAKDTAKKTVKRERQMVEEVNVKSVDLTSVEDDTVIKKDIKVTKVKEIEKNENITLENVKTEKKKPKSKKKFYEKIFGILKKIKYTFRKICDTIKLLVEQKENVQEFIADEVHKYTFRKCKKELLYLWSHIKPKKLKVDFEFGFEDPSTTGKALAVMSVFGVMYEEQVNIVPNFEEKEYNGSWYLSGRVRMIYLVISGMKIIFDKKIRSTYKDIRNIKFLKKHK